MVILSLFSIKEKVKLVPYIKKKKQFSHTIIGNQLEETAVTINLISLLYTHTQITTNVIIFILVIQGFTILILKGPGGSMSQVVGLPNINRQTSGESASLPQYDEGMESAEVATSVPNISYKLITNMAWVRALLCKLYKRVYSTRNHK